MVDSIIAIFIFFLGVMLPDGINAGVTPVLVWGIKTKELPLLHTVTQAEFSEIMQPIVKQNMVVVFLEEELNAEDLSLYNPKTATPCFAYLRTTAPHNFYGSVKEPLEVMKSYARSNISWHTFDHMGRLPYQIQCKVGHVHVLNFTDEHFERYREMEAHDTAIGMLTFKLHCRPTVFVYMAVNALKANEPLIERYRERRESTDEGTSGNKSNILVQDEFAFTFKTASITAVGSKKTYPLKFKEMTVELTDVSWLIAMQVDGEEASNIIKKAGGEPVLKFHLKRTSGYYYAVRAFTFGNVQFGFLDMEYPISFSFYCGDVSSYALKKEYKIKFQGLQFELFENGPVSAENFTFSEAWYCSKYFSSAIISGLFVMAILLSIAFLGVCCILDIGRNDRMENPQSKPLVIIEQLL